MIWATSITALLLLAEGAAAPFGWDCAVEQDLGPLTAIQISDDVFGPGRRGMTQLVRVRFRPSRPATETQMFQWSVFRRELPLDDPDLLSLKFDVRKRVSKATLKIDTDGSSVTLPLVLPLESSRGKAYVQIDDDAVLHALWRAKQWRVSVLDRHGQVQTFVDGGLPGREAVQIAFDRLQPALDKKVADPGGQCTELGENAWI
jgi:hypothetical protein